MAAFIFVSQSKKLNEIISARHCNKMSAYRQQATRLANGFDCLIFLDNRIYREPFPEIHLIILLGYPILRRLSVELMFYLFSYIFYPLFQVEHF